MKVNAQKLIDDMSSIKHLGEIEGIENSEDIVKIATLLLNIDTILEPLNAAAKIAARTTNKKIDKDGKLNAAEMVAYDERIEEIYNRDVDIGAETNIPLSRAKKWNIKPNVLKVALKYKIVINE